jgi:hypothetical protein
MLGIIDHLPKVGALMSRIGFRLPAHDAPAADLVAGGGHVRLRR